MNKGIIGTTAVAAAWLLSPSALGLEPPNDVDLKTAYCLGLTVRNGAVLKHFMEMAEGFKNSETDAIADKMRITLKEIQQREDRFNRYLKPRLKYLDQAGLTAALKQGAEDADSYYLPATPDTKAKAGQLPDECGSECKGSAGNKNKFSACYQSCIRRDPLGGRVLRCEEAQFLPF